MSLATACRRRRSKPTSTRSPPSRCRSPASSTASGTPIFFEPGTYGSAADPLVFQVGYYTQVAGLGAMPQDTVVDGAIDVFNNLCTAGHHRLQRRRQLLALAVQPDAQRGPAVDPADLRAAGGRRLRRRLRQQRRDVGGLAGRADPSGHHQRQRRLPGLLREQQLRQRRVHRRQPDQRRPRLLRQPAVHGPQQFHRRGKRVPERPVEHGLLRRRGRARAGLHRAVPAEHRPGDEPRHRGRTVPVHRRERRVQGLRARGSAQFRRHVLGQRHARRAVPCRCRRSSSRTRPRRCR